MIKIANAPCSWGALEFDFEEEAVGFHQVLDEIKETGYLGTEFGDWGFFPTNPRELKMELKKRDLSLIGAFVPIFFKDANKHNEAVEHTIRIATLMKEAGFPNAFIILADENGSNEERTINAGRIKPAMELNSEEWPIFAKGVNMVAQAVKSATGLRCAFHHHCAGYIETPEEIDKLLSLTDPSLVGLVLDTGHITFAGGDPLELLKKYKDRIWHIHFKDCEPHIAKRSRREKMDYFQSIRAGVFCELGKGTVNFKGIVEELQKYNYNDWIVVEQDVLPGMGNPKLYAQQNRNYLKTLGL